jgi:hypothetical protein
MRWLLRLLALALAVAVTLLLKDGDVSYFLGAFLPFHHDGWTLYPPGVFDQTMTKLEAVAIILPVAAILLVLSFLVKRPGADPSNI